MSPEHAMCLQLTSVFVCLLRMVVGAGLKNFWAENYVGDEKNAIIK